MKKFLALALALVMIFSFAACGGKADDDTTAATEATEATDAADDTTPVYKIGGIGPTTGPAAIYGQAVANGAQIAVDEINAAGDIKIEFKFEDDEHDPEKSVNAYNALKDWDMQILLGSVTSDPCTAVAGETFADRMFQLTPSGSSTTITEGKDNVFQVCFADPNQGTGAAQYIADNKLGEKIAVIYQSDISYSTGIYDTFKAKAAEENLDIVYEGAFTNDTKTDFSVQISQAKDAGADFIFLPIYYQEASLIFNQAETADYHPTYFGVDGMDGILTLEGFDTALAEGVYLLTPFAADAQDDATKAFVAKYQEAYGEIPNQFAADAYDGIYIIAEAIKAGKVSADMTAEEMCDALVGAMTEISVDGLTGQAMTWSANGEVSKAPIAVVIEDGAYVGSSK